MMIIIIIIIIKTILFGKPLRTSFRLPFFNFFLHVINKVIVTTSTDIVSQILGPKTEIRSVSWNTVLTFFF